MTVEDPVSVLTSQSDISLPPFNNYTTRKEDMSDSTSAVISYLADSTADWHSHQVMEKFAAVQGELPSLSWKNALLVALQYPQATYIRHKNAWAEDGLVGQSNESKIWIWEPIYDTACPKCGNTPAYHSRSHISCDYHQTGTPEHWPTDVVGTTPAPYYDVNQVAGVDAESSVNRSPLRNIGGKALEAICETVITEDGYQLNKVSEWELDGSQGQLRRSAMTLKPLIDIVSSGQPQEALSAVKYHLLADFTTNGAESGYTDRDESLAAWIVYCIGSHIGYHESHYSPDIGATPSIGDSPDTVKEGLQTISTTAESHINRLKQHTRRRRREFQDSI
jgi:hypothetical protein